MADQGGQSREYEVGQSHEEIEGWRFWEEGWREPNDRASLSIWVLWLPGRLPSV